MKEANQRRSFLKTTLMLGAVGAMAGTALLTGCEESEGDEKEVSPPEDLMQEHGVLNRILLIYDHCKIRLLQNESFPVEALNNAARIIRTFIEDYHEKQEEDYLFPRFKKANQLTELVDVLIMQHEAGRRITAQVISISSQATRTASENQKLIELLTSFNSMYRPHEAREDTVLFPAFENLFQDMNTIH